MFWVPSADHRCRRNPHRELTRSGQCSDQGVKGVEGLKGFSAWVSPPSLNPLHFSPREALEKNYPHCSPLIETLLLALDLGAEGLELNRSRVKGPTVHRSPSGRRTAPSRTRASG